MKWHLVVDDAASRRRKICELPSTLNELPELLMCEKEDGIFVRQKAFFRHAGPERAVRVLERGRDCDQAGLRMLAGANRSVGER
jgi:hypothetical protein